MPVGLYEVRRQIESAAKRAGRSAEDIRLIAVSKTRSLAEVQRVFVEHQTVFGENQVQDALDKIPALAWPRAEWHLIGPLQSNKVRYIPGNFQWIHTLDSTKLAKKLDAAMLRYGEMSPLNCLLQVNVTGESTKSGLHVEQVEDVLRQLLELELNSLKYRGLMTIGIQNDESLTRKAFARLRGLRDSCQKRFALVNFDQLSMGMSDDFEIAIEEGATMVRIGTRIFGERNRSD